MFQLIGIGSRLSWSFADIGVVMEAPGDLRSKLMGQQVNYKFLGSKLLKNFFNASKS